MLRDVGGGGESIHRQQQAFALEQWLQNGGLAERLASAQGRHEFIQSLDGDQFVGLLLDMNAVLLDQTEVAITTELNAPFDHEAAETLDVMPAPEDKIGLLHDVLAAAQGIDDPALQAVALGFGINEVHPFADGNGRVARAIYLLLSQDYQPGQERFYLALGENGDQTVNLNPHFYTTIIYEMLKSRLGSHEPDPATGDHSIPP